MKKQLSTYLTFFFLWGIALPCIAQKLPNKQEVSVRAPAGVKVDGNAADWNNQYQAYNRGTEIFYTLANDNDNLYLVIHAVNPRVIEKLTEGGVSFTLNSSGKANDKKNVIVLFPLLSMQKSRSILTAAGIHISELDALGGDRMLRRNNEQDLLVKHPPAFGTANNDMAANEKEIKVLGIKSVTDTVTSENLKSRYYQCFPLREHYFKVIGKDNNDGIKAMTQFDDKGALTYELAIPLKCLNLRTNQKLNYNIKLNARGEDGRLMDMISWSAPPNRQILNQDLETPTGFWGEYTLAKNN